MGIFFKFLGIVQSLNFRARVWTRFALAQCVANGIVGHSKKLLERRIRCGHGSYCGKRCNVGVRSGVGVGGVGAGMEVEAGGRLRPQARRGAGMRCVGAGAEAEQVRVHFEKVGG